MRAGLLYDVTPQYCDKQGPAATVKQGMSVLTTPSGIEIVAGQILSLHYLLEFDIINYVPAFRPNAMGELIRSNTNLIKAK